MGLVKRLRCEKKLRVDGLVDKKYETENDSNSVSSSSFDSATNSDFKSLPQRKTKHRWFFHVFKSHKASDCDDNDCDDNFPVVSANHFAEFLDKRAAVLNDINNLKIGPDTEFPRNIGNLRNISVVECSNSYIPEGYWQNNVLPKFSADQRDLLAESMFFHIWKTQGKEEASQILKDHNSNSLSTMAEEHFDHGCQLWAKDDAEAAHSEFKRSRELREIQSTEKNLLHVQYSDDGDEGSKKCNNKHESNAELCFALGMIQSAREDNHAALKEFRRAMQVSALGLGMDHELTEASSYMIRSIYLTMGQSAKEIKHNISQLTSDLNHEIEGDQLYESGKKEQALVEYANLKLLYDADSMVQARVITKMATIFEEKNDFAKAMDLWTDLLVLYEDTPSIGLHHPLARHALKKIVNARRRLQPWSEI